MRSFSRQGRRSQRCPIQELGGKEPVQEEGPRAQSVGVQQRGGSKECDEDREATSLNSRRRLHIRGPMNGCPRSCAGHVYAGAYSCPGKHPAAFSLSFLAGTGCPPPDGATG